MADLSTAYGVQHTKYKTTITDGTTGMASFVTQQWNSRVQMVHDEYTVPTDDTIHTSATLYMGIVPKGARVLFFMFNQSGGGEAATGGIQIGTTAVTGAAALTDMTSATSQILPSLIAASGTALTADSTVSIVFSADADVDGDTNLTLTTFYIQDGIGA